MNVIRYKHTPQYEHFLLVLIRGFASLKYEQVISESPYVRRFRALENLINARHSFSTLTTTVFSQWICILNK